MKYILIAGGTIALATIPLFLHYNQKTENIQETRLEQKIQKTTPQKKKDPLEQLFTERPVTYIDFDNINYNNIPKEKINVPSDFNERIRSYGLFLPKFKDQSRFEEDVLAEAKKLGYNQETLKNITAQQAISCCIDILSSRFQYFDVDKNQEFIQKHGKDLKLDEHFALGKGDCDKYCAAFMAAFDIIKKINPNLENIYASGNDLGGNPLDHAWNSLILLTKDKTLVTHIDITAHDAGGELQAKQGIHIPEDNVEFLANFFLGTRAHDLCYQNFGILYDKTTDLKEKAYMLSVMVDSATELKDAPKMNEARGRYDALCAQGLKDDDLAARLLYCSFCIEVENKNQTAAEVYHSELSRKYPGSDYTKMAGEELEIIKMEEYLDLLQKHTEGLEKEAEKFMSDDRLK